MKLAMWLLLAVLVWWAWRKQQGASTPAPGPRAPAAPAGAEAMLHCPHCGVHFPASEAVRDSRGTAYCCEEHLHALT